MLEPAYRANGGAKAPASAEQLLGTSDQTSLPVWLKPELFLAQGFDAEACVADLRRFVSDTRTCACKSATATLSPGLSAQCSPQASPRTARQSMLRASGPPSSLLVLQAPLSALQTELQAYLSVLKAKVRTSEHTQQQKQLQPEHTLYMLIPA